MARYGIFLPRRWRRQPTDKVALDLNHPLVRDIVFLAVPWEGGREMLSGVAATYSGVTIGPSSDGLAFQSPNTTSGAWFDLPTGHPVYQRLDNNTRFSLMFRGGITSAANYGALLSIDFTTSHTDPYNTLALVVEGVTTAMRTATSGTFGQYGGRISATGYFDTTGALATYVVGASSGGGSAFSWWKSGVPATDSSSVGNYAPQPLDNNIPVTLFAHSNSFLTTGTAGFCTLAAFWARTLGDADAQELHVNPWQIFKRDPSCIYFDVAAATGATTTALLPAGVGAMGAGITKAILPAGVGYMG